MNQLLMPVSGFPSPVQLAQTLAELGSYLRVDGDGARLTWDGIREIRAETRLHGNCAMDKPGERDFVHARAVRDSLAAVYSDCDVVVGSVNEFVYVSVRENVPARAG